MHNAEVVLQAIEAVERRDRARQAELFHPDCEFRWPPSLPFQSGWERVWNPLQPGPAERRMDARAVASQCDEVVVLWQQRALSPAGKRFECSVLGLYQVRNGKVARAQMFYFDTTATAEFLTEASA
jgi:ketosteroid isomerase-like protein